MDDNKVIMSQLLPSTFQLLKLSTIIALYSRLLSHGFIYYMTFYLFKSCVSKLLFMSERAYNKEAASLISNGPEGHILFWKVFEGGSLEADFPGVSRLTHCSA